MKDYVIESLVYKLGLEKLTHTNGKFNFRCPLCGDSAISQKKKRGWIFEKKGDYFFHCFNCGETLNIKTFLKRINFSVYQEYITEKLLKEKPITEEKKEINKTILQYEKLDIPDIMSLGKNHIAYRYLSSRKIPLKYFNNIYYTDSYKAFVNSLLPNKFENITRDEARIVIPIYNLQKKIVGVQGRSLNKYSKVRYITILFNDNELNVCGLERYNRNETIYVTEGFFDSLFLPNAISMNSSDIDLNRLLEIASKDKFVFVFDNEPRNREIVSKMMKICKSDYRICIWNTSMKGKDINEMYLNGNNMEYIKETIDKNICSGFQAQIRIRLLK